MSTIKEITKSFLLGIAYYVKVNLNYFAIMIQIAIPYVMYVIGHEFGVRIGIELIIPIIALIIVYYMKEAANRCGVGNNIPKPKERFTKIDSDGEVTIENRRVQELILYMADLEDWMDRKGWL